MSSLPHARPVVPLRITVSPHVQAVLVGRVYHLIFPAHPAATACARLAAGSRWDPQRQVWLVPAGDADRVRITLERIEKALRPGPNRARASDLQEEDEPKILVRDGEASISQRIHTPEGWAVIGSLGPAFLGGERLRRDGRPDLVGVALRWAYYQIAAQEAA